MDAEFMQKSDLQTRRSACITLIVWSLVKLQTALNRSVVANLVPFPVKKELLFLNNSLWLPF